VSNKTKPPLNISIQATTAKFTARKLKVKWSTESANDLKAFHVMEVEVGVTIPTDLKEDKDFVKGKLYKRSMLPGKRFGVLLFLGYQLLGTELFGHKFYFLNGDQPVCFYYPNFTEAKGGLKRIK